jgi:hypothetical protein
MNPLAGTLRSLAVVLDRLGIPYVIGGSMASSARGVARATLDVDIVAAILATQTERFAHELGGEWYADADQMRQAIAARRAFNVIHISLGNKVDIFPATEDFHASQLRRATRIVLPYLEDAIEYPVATAEDILLAKLQWYEAGGEASETQWKDILGIIGSNPDLDLSYTQSWGTRLGLARLLARALNEGKAGA